MVCGRESEGAVPNAARETLGNTDCYRGKGRRFELRAAGANQGKAGWLCGLGMQLGDCAEVEKVNRGWVTTAALIREDSLPAHLESN